MTANKGMDVQNHLYNGKKLDRMHGLNLYDYSARQYDPVISQFTSIDPLCEKYYHISPYAYCAGNPVKYVDPDGRAIETAWDVANFVMDAASLCQNAKDGNVGAAIVDGLCLVADGAAVCLPFVPGGAGAVVKTVRGGEKAIKAVDKVSDTAKTIDKASDATRNIGKYSNVAEPKNVAPGKAFTRKQRERLLEENRKRNGGVLTHDLTGEKLNSPKQCKKGQKADMNQAEVDHIIPKSMGGSNSNSNAQIISKRDNLKKGNKLL